MLSLENVSFGYSNNANAPAIHVVSDITLGFKQSEVSVLLGPSGCGKTTILNLIAQLLPITKGRISYFNHGANKGCPVGYVFQTPSLIPWRTIRENVLFGAELNGKKTDTLEQHCNELLELYGLADFENSYPLTLSGGMQQRASIIRAVLSDAKIILLDEPFSNSDFLMRRDLQRDLSRIVSKEKLTAILVTHDIEEAVRVGDKIVILSPRPATVKAEIEIPIPREERLKTGAVVMIELRKYVEQLENIFRSSLTEPQDAD